MRSFDDFFNDVFLDNNAIKAEKSSIRFPFQADDHGLFIHGNNEFHVEDGFLYFPCHCCGDSHQADYLGCEEDLDNFDPDMHYCGKNPSCCP